MAALFQVLTNLGKIEDLAVERDVQPFPLHWLRTQDRQIENGKPGVDQRAMAVAPCALTVRTAHAQARKCRLRARLRNGRIEAVQINKSGNTTHGFDFECQSPQGEASWHQLRAYDVAESKE